MTRLDFIFSHWIYLWYLLYILNRSNNFPNPKFILIIAILQNIIIILEMFKRKTKNHVIILLILGMLIFKIIPLYTISNTNISLIDISTSIILLLCYFFWLYLHNIHHSTYLYNMNVIIDTNNKMLGELYTKILSIL
jgi:hypothetical protein